jgi:hypothetical protein
MRLETSEKLISSSLVIFEKQFSMIVNKSLLVCRQVNGPFLSCQSKSSMLSVQVGDSLILIRARYFPAAFTVCSLLYRAIHR